MPTVMTQIKFKSSNFVLPNVSSILNFIQALIILNLLHRIVKPKNFAVFFSIPVKGVQSLHLFNPWEFILFIVHQKILSNLTSFF